MKVLNNSDLVERERISVKQEIVDTIERICTNDCSTCKFGYCMFNMVCARPYFTTDKLPHKLKTLKSVLSNAKSKERKKNGVVVPDVARKAKGATPKGKTLEPYDWIERARIMLGCEPKDHPLIKNSKWAKKALVGGVNNMFQLTELLQTRNKQVHGKKLILIGSWQSRIK